MACLEVQNLPGGGRVSLTEGESAALRGRLPQSLAVSLSNGWRRERNPRMRAVSSSWGVFGGRHVDATLGLARAGESGDLKCEKSAGRDQRKKPTIALQLDQLMKESVAEIVKNINEAPFLVHVYPSKGGNGPTLSTNPSKLVIEKASSDSWPSIRQRWEDGNPYPDGIILVEELQSEDDVLVDSEKEEMGSNDRCTVTSNQLFTPSSTKIWGLLVQGRGVSCPSCYILKTCQVQCCFGFSTHFCLSKVECLGKSVDYHLSKLWLQR